MVGKSMVFSRNYKAKLFGTWCEKWCGEGAIVQDEAEETGLIKGLGLYSEVKVIQSFKLMRVFKSSKFHFRKQHSGWNLGRGFKTEQSRWDRLGRGNYNSSGWKGQ